MLTFRGNAIIRTLTNTISKFYVNLYNTTSSLENINGATTLSSAMIPIWIVVGNNWLLVLFEDEIKSIGFSYAF
ncbi:hypothetical protein [Lactococcus lactis]|jgi:hypothetical protein|uniref:hypothetical protein n=1 Tax=Lactococcus lactis TaxID=1358 RepID=UPI0028588D5A|nr:hypothetical protein [Lactococcus lactis]MDR7697800.1 hypothetical protein [Lactococcus lactis]